MFEAIEISDAAANAIVAAPDRKFTVVAGVTLLGEQVATGIKKREVSPRVPARVANELYLLDRLLTRFPKHSGAVPLFTYAVKVGEEHEGILTEDFTRSGTRLLTEGRIDFTASNRKREHAPTGIYRDVYDALDGRVYPEAFSHMCGFAFDREVLIDFNDVAYPENDETEAYKALVDSMTLQLPEAL
jgi:hypothetical protein